MRAIGVRNFMPGHLRELLANCRITPAVNQIELSPFLPQRALRELCRAQGITVVAYSPLTKGTRLADPVLGANATRLERTPAQILLRWVIEHDAAVVVKSSDPLRMRQNLGLFAFTLNAEAVAALAGLDQGLVTGWDPRGVA